MSNLNKYFGVALVAACGLSFTACSEDDLTNNPLNAGVYVSQSGITYQVSSENPEEAVILYSSNRMGDVEIPSVASFNGGQKKVVGIAHTTQVGASFAFQDNFSTTSFSVPATLVNIEKFNAVADRVDNPFSGCWNVKSFTVDPENPIYDSRENCNALVETATNTIVSGFATTIIPESVTAVGEHAFEGITTLEKIEIPATLKSIGNEAFVKCRGLKHIVLPANLSAGELEIAGTAFGDCDALSKFTMPGDVEFSAILPNYAENLKELEILEGSTSIAPNAFWGCSALGSVVIPASVNQVGEGAFSGTAVKHLVTNSAALCSVEPFGDKETLETVEIGGGVTSLPENAFKECVNLEKVVLGEGLTTIGNSAFEGCKAFTEIKFPTSLATIGESAFSMAEGLTEVTIPAGVTSLGSKAFANIEGLKAVFCQGVTPCSVQNDTFDMSGFDKTTWLYGSFVIGVPASAVEAYKQAWKEVLGEEGDWRVMSVEDAEEYLSKQF